MQNKSARKTFPYIYWRYCNFPNFAQRLHLIGKAIQTYQKREPLMIRYQEIAQRLLQLLDGENPKFRKRPVVTISSKGIVDHFVIEFACKADTKFFLGVSGDNGM